MSNLDPDFLAIKEEDIFEEARDRHKAWMDAEAHNLAAAKDDLLFREGENHWDSNFVTSESQESPELVINFTDTYVTRVVNNIADLDTRGKCHPVGEGADTEQADVINGLGRHIEYRSNASVAYDNGTDSSVTIGWGFWELVADWEDPKSFNKEIGVSQLMNTLSVAMDPAAIMPDGSDAMWGIISFMMKRTEFVRMYPEQEILSWSGAADRQGWEDKDEIRVAKYYRIREKTETLCRVKSFKSGEEYTCFRSELPIQAALDLMQAKVVQTRESSRHQVEYFKLNGSKVIDREILPGYWIPIVRCQGNARSIDGKIYRRGMVRTLQDPQRMVDYGEAAKIKRLGLTPQSPWTAYEGQLNGHPEWTDANRAPNVVLIHKPVVVETANGSQLLPPPVRQPPAQVEAGFSEFIQSMRGNLMAIAGMPNEPGQDTQDGTATSGKALQRRDRMSDQSHSQYYKNKKLAIAHTWRIMLSWIPHYYSEERMQRIIGGDGKPQMVKLNQQILDADGEDAVKNDMTVGKYDVVMEAGPSYETQREDDSEQLMSMLSSPVLAELIAKKAPDLLFRSMGFMYADEIADRLAAETPEGLKKIMENLPKEARAVVQSLAGENANLKQALQAAQQELKFGITKAHLAAATKAHDTEMSNETKRADTQSRERTTIHKTNLDNTTKLHIEEVAAGAQLMGKHQDAGYEAIARKETEEAASRAEKSNGAS